MTPSLSSQIPPFLIFLASLTISAVTHYSTVLHQTYSQRRHEDVNYWRKKNYAELKSNHFFPIYQTAGGWPNKPNEWNILEVSEWNFFSPQSSVLRIQPTKHPSSVIKLFKPQCSMSQEIIDR